MLGVVPGGRQLGGAGRVLGGLVRALLARQCLEQLGNWGSRPGFGVGCCPLGQELADSWGAGIYQVQ